MIRNKVVLLLSAFLVASCSAAPADSSISSEPEHSQEESVSSLAPSSSEAPSSELSSESSAISEIPSSSEASSSEEEEDYSSEDFEFAKWGVGLILKKV